MTIRKCIDLGERFITKLNGNSRNCEQVSRKIDLLRRRDFRVCTGCVYRWRFRLGSRGGGMAIAEQMQIDSRNPNYLTGRKMTREGLEPVVLALSC